MITGARLGAAKPRKSVAGTWGRAASGCGLAHGGPGGGAGAVPTTVFFSSFPDSLGLFVMSHQVSLSPGTTRQRKRLLHSGHLTVGTRKEANGRSARGQTHEGPAGLAPGTAPKARDLQPPLAARRGREPLECPLTARGEHSLAPHPGCYAATQRKDLLGLATPCMAHEDVLLSEASQALNDQNPLTPRRAAPGVRFGDASCSMAK